MAEKLPVFATIGEALRLLRQEGYRVLLLGAVVALATTVQQALVVKLGLNAPHPDISQLAYLLLMGLVSFAFYLPLVTGAHRIVLQGEQGRTGWGLHREEWLYVLSSFRLMGPFLAVALIVFVLSLILGAMAIPLHADQATFMMAMGTVSIFFVSGIWFLICRYMLIFPAAAIGEKLSLRRSSELLKGNTWRFFWLISLVSIATSLINAALVLLGPGLWLLQATVIGIVYSLDAILVAFLLSLTYRRLTSAEAHVST